MRRGRAGRPAQGATGLLLPLLLAFAAPAGASGPPAVIAGSAWVVDAPTKVAEVSGFFARPVGEEAARAIELRYFGSGVEALEQLLAGEADFALAAATPVAAAIRRQDAARPQPEDVVVLASVGLSNQSHYLVAARDRGIAHAEDLPGRRIGLLLGSSAHFAWSRLARAQGLDADAVTLVDLAPAEQSEALIDGKIDAVMTWDPFGAALLQTLGDQAVMLSTREFHAVSWLLLTSRSLVEREPDLVERVLRGYLDAVALIHDDPGRARSLHAGRMGLTEAELQAVEPGIFWRVDLGWSLLVNLEEQFAWQAELSSEPFAVAPEPAAYIAAGPLLRLAPDKIGLPAYIHSRSARTGTP